MVCCSRKIAMKQCCKYIFPFFRISSKCGLSQEASAFFWMFSLWLYNEGREFERFQFRVNVYQQQSFTSSTLLFQLDGGSCFSNIHFTLSGKAGSPDANGIIRSIRKEEALQSQTLVRIRTSTISPNKEIPAGLRVSCASLRACPYFGLTLKYLRVRLYHFICFFIKTKKHRHA